jgi:hypothetical protein
VADYQADIRRLCNEGDGLPHSPAKVAVLEEAVRLADTHSDTAAGFMARRSLISAAIFSGMPERALVAFSWCLAQCDRDPTQFDEGELLWEYKWITDYGCYFSEISRQQIEQLLDDMAQRHQKAGSTLHAVYQIRRDAAVRMGDRAAAEAAHARFQKTPRDWLSNCRACVAHEDVAYYAFLGDPAQAVNEAAQVLSGKLKCAEEPHRTYPIVLEPLLRLGRPAEAMTYHHRGYRLIVGNPPEFIPYFGQHITFLTLTGNLPRAVTLVETHLGSALQSRVAAYRFEFFLAARILIDQLVETGAANTPIRQPDGSSDAVALAGSLDTELADLAARFDARNGNDMFARRINGRAELQELRTPWPLKGTTGD